MREKKNPPEVSEGQLRIFIVIAVVLNLLLQFVYNCFFNISMVGVDSVHLGRVIL